MYSWLWSISRFPEAERARGRNSSLEKHECVKQKHCLQTKSQSSCHSLTSTAEGKGFRVVHLSKLFLGYICNLKGHPFFLRKEQKYKKGAKIHITATIWQKAHPEKPVLHKGLCRWPQPYVPQCCHSAAHTEWNEPPEYFIHGSKHEFPLRKAETEEDTAFYT